MVFLKRPFYWIWNQRPENWIIWNVARLLLLLSVRNLLHYFSAEMTTWKKMQKAIKFSEIDIITFKITFSTQSNQNELFKIEMWHSLVLKKYFERKEKIPELYHGDFFHNNFFGINRMNLFAVIKIMEIRLRNKSRSSVKNNAQHEYFECTNFLEHLLRWRRACPRA